MHFDHTHINPVVPGFFCSSWSSWLYVLIGSAVKTTARRRYRPYAFLLTPGIQKIGSAFAVSFSA